MSIDERIGKIAYFFTATLASAKKYDVRPHYKIRRSDVISTAYFVTQLFELDVKRKEIMEILKNEDKLGAGGRRFLHEVANQARHIQKTYRRWPSRLYEPIQLPLPFSPRQELYDIISQTLKQ